MRSLPHSLITARVARGPNISVEACTGAVGCAVPMTVACRPIDDGRTLQTVAAREVVIVFALTTGLRGKGAVG